MDATAFCSNHVWKRWFWPQKLSMNAPRFESAFWNAVYSKSAFWNAVYSKISMDATAFCSNHVWKRWFWPQKFSINAPLVMMSGLVIWWGVVLGIVVLVGNSWALFLSCGELSPVGSCPRTFINTCIFMFIQKYLDNINLLLFHTKMQS